MWPDIRLPCFSNTWCILMSAVQHAHSVQMHFSAAIIEASNIEFARRRQFNIPAVPTPKFGRCLCRCAVRMDGACVRYKVGGRIVSAFSRSTPWYLQTGTWHRYGHSRRSSSWRSDSLCVNSAATSGPASIMVSSLNHSNTGPVQRRHSFVMKRGSPGAAPGLQTPCSAPASMSITTVKLGTELYFGVRLARWMNA